MSWNQADFLAEMKAAKTLRESKPKIYREMADKAEQMAKFLYPEAVADAFREYADCVLTAIVMLDKDLALPIMKEVIKKEMEEEENE